MSQGVLGPASVSSSVKWMIISSLMDAASVLKRTATGPLASTHSSNYVIVFLALQHSLKEDLG